jgi:hypothetical protein
MIFNLKYQDKIFAMNKKTQLFEVVTTIPFCVHDVKSAMQIKIAIFASHACTHT